VDLVLIDSTGKTLQGSREASSEIAMHLAVYRQRPDICAVLHAHPPKCIALMLAGFSLDKALLPETVVAMGKVPTAAYSRPSTGRVAEVIRPWVEQTDFLLLDRHGSLNIGATLQEAMLKLEMMENTARIYHSALQLGPIKELPLDEIEALNDLRIHRYQIPWRLIPFP
jgi:L-fuculose-phosphate aldolase